jgi:hypothetical protein
MHLPASPAGVRRVQQVECEAHFVILACEHSAKMKRGVPSDPPAACASPVAVHVLRASDPVRGDILPAMDHAALLHGEASVVARAHRAYLAMNAHLLPLKACALPRSQASMLDSASNAPLLVVFALHNRILRLLGRGGLGKRDGGRCNHSRHKYKLCESHGVSPSVTAVT